MSITNKVVLVTGAGGGFGKEISKKMVEKGAKVVLADIDFESANSAAKEVNNEYKESEGVAFPVEADISNEDDVIKMVNRIKEKFGPVNILVNNAGIARSDVIQNVELKDWNKIMDVNLTGAFLCVKYVVEDMIENGYGKIVNISSISGQTGRRTAPEYASSKAGLIGLTRNLAYNLADYCINVNAIAPGPVITPIFEEDFTDEVVKELKDSIPFGRQGTPEDIANAVLFLTSEESSWITGQTLAVNGGAFMY